jgi:2-polyprenyl-6-hydroxyphenyl methylase/3-demethylubiquinone-9 3-methyltransferase
MSTAARSSGVARGPSIMSVRPRNDLGQYDDLVDEWWEPRGEFAALHWLAAARGRLVPPSPRPGALLLDLGCGGGLLAPHLTGYRHVGVDLSETALAVASDHGVETVRADVADLPFDDEAADVVVAGEILEHIPHLSATVAEIGRVLRPGGTLVFDTINATRFARISLVTLGERLAGGPPRGCHDPGLFVAPERLRALCAEQGIEVRMRGLRPAFGQYLSFLAGRRSSVRMLPTRSLAGVYQGVGVKALGKASGDPGDPGEEGPGR